MGRRAVDSAALSGPDNCREYLTLRHRPGVGGGDRLLDVACGAGPATEFARLRGAGCAGCAGVPGCRGAGVPGCRGAGVPVHSPWYPGGAVPCHGRNSRLSWRGVLPQATPGGHVARRTASASTTSAGWPNSTAMPRACSTDTGSPWFDPSQTLRSGLSLWRHRPSA